jgi:hypothetical protein
MFYQEKYEVFLEKPSTNTLSYILLSFTDLNIISVSMDEFKYL